LFETGLELEKALPLLLVPGVDVVGGTVVFGEFAAPAEVDPAPGAPAVAVVAFDGSQLPDGAVNSAREMRPSWFVSIVLNWPTHGGVVSERLRELAGPCAEDGLTGVGLAFAESGLRLELVDVDELLRVVGSKAEDEPAGWLSEPDAEPDTDGL
jgi:hypothetical protein